MSFDALSELRAAGHSIDLLTHDQQQVLAELDESEVAFLTRLRDRLDKVAPEVQGQNTKVL